MHASKLASIQIVAWKILEKHHIDPVSVFKKVRLNPALMYQPGARHPLDKVADLWKEMANRIKDPCFGLTSAECWHPSNFGTLGYAMLVSTSLRMALERLIRFHRVIEDIDFGEIHEDKSAGTLTFTISNIKGTSFSPAREDAALVWLMSILRMNYQDELAAVSVNFTHPAPVCSGEYYNFFKSPVQFDSSIASLSLSLEAAEQILPSANEELAAFNDHLMTDYLADLDEKDILTQVKRIIVEHLPSGDATVEVVASELYYSSRNFQRTLQQEGTTFTSLLTECRMELATQYVKDNKVDLTDLAFLLGFSELSTFSRSFKRWTGKSPSQYRNVA